MAPKTRCAPVEGENAQIMNCDRGFPLITLTALSAVTAPGLALTGLAFVIGAPALVVNGCWG